MYTVYKPFSSEAGAGPRYWDRVSDNSTTGIDSGNRALVVALGSRQEQTNKQTHRTHQNQSPTFSVTFGHFNFIFTFTFNFIFCFFYDIFFAPELAVDFHPGRVELLSHELAVCDVVI